MKQKKAHATHPVGNRTVIGIICIVVALAICFGIAPLVNRLSDGKTKIVRLTRDISAGATITEADIEVVDVGSYNLPTGVIKDKAQVVGKCALSNLTKGDYLFPSKIGNDTNNAGRMLESLDENHKAISITIGSFALGFSGKLETGDIVGILVYDQVENRSYTPKELTYVKVITTTMVFTEIEKEYIRISQNEYLRKSCVSFDTSDIEIIKGLVESYTVDEWYLPLQKFAECEERLPNRVEINEFVMESLANELDLGWHVVQPRIKDRRYQKGIMVRNDNSIMTYDALVASVLLSKGISELSEAQLLSFMQIHQLAGRVNGFCVFISFSSALSSSCLYHTRIDAGFTDNSSDISFGFFPEQYISTALYFCSWLYLTTFLWELQDHTPFSLGRSSFSHSFIKVLPGYPRSVIVLATLIP